MWVLRCAGLAGIWIFLTVVLELAHAIGWHNHDKSPLEHFVVAAIIALIPILTLLALMRRTDRRSD